VDWKGEVPEGVKSIRLRNQYVSLAPHIAVYGEEDLPNVHALQKGLKVIALKDWGKSNEVLKPGEPMRPIRRADAKMPPDVYTQLKSHPNYVGDGRLKWDRKPRSAADKSATTPNATTLYGFGFADLRREPMVVIVPGRYFSFQASDQYPRWFMQVGNQFTGRAEQQYLIVGPDFRGPYPAGFAAAQVHQSPSNCVLMAVRYALKSSEPAELAAVNALQDRTTVAATQHMGKERPQRHSRRGSAAHRTRLRHSATHG
jgi:hypothetical protein